MSLQNLLARQSPSTYKIRYLVHMEDCRSSAHHGIEHGLLVLNTVLEWVGTQQKSIRLWDAGRSFEDRAIELQADLEFVCEGLTKMKNDIADLKHTLYEHQALTHDRRNFILTLLAAVFLPLSFASTFFGMNMNTMTSSGPTGFSNWTTAWILDSPTDVQNSTRALASTIGSSGTLTYNWKTYIITAACLVLTLPLSLTIGSILRTVYRATAYYSTYWRAFAVLPTLVLVLGSVFGTYFDDVGAFVSFGCNGIVLSYLCLKIYRSWKSRQRRGFWIISMLVTSFCFPISLLSAPPVMLLPWLYFAFIWLLPWLKRWRQEKKARKQNENSNELEMTPIPTSPADQIESVASTASIQRS